MRSEKPLLSPVVFHCRGPDCSRPRHLSSRQEILISICESDLLRCYGSRLSGWKPPQKLPVCCRHTNSAFVCGSTESSPGLVARKASGLMDPARGSFRDGHMIQGKPLEPSKGRGTSAAHPFFRKSSTSIALCIWGVPSRSGPFFAIKSSRAALHTGVVRASGV